MPIPLVQDQPEPQDYVDALDKMPTSLGDQVGTALKSEFGNALTSRIIDHGRLQDGIPEMGLHTEPGGVPEMNTRVANPPGASPEPLMSVGELNARYQGLDISWDGPKKPFVAEIIADKKRNQILDEEKINAGPQGWASTGLRFGAGVVAHAVDPTELALTVGTAGIFRGAAAVAFGEKALEGAGLATRLALGAGEGATVGAALEPTQYGSDKEFQRDYNSADALQRVLFGAGTGMLMEGGHYAFGKLFGKSSTTAKMSGTPADATARDLSLTQFEQGKPVDPSPVVNDFERERSGALPPDQAAREDYSGRINYEHQPFDPQAPGGKKLYLGVNSGEEIPQLGDRKIHGPEGFTDNPLIANADAASKWNGNSGTMVHELTLSPEAKILSTSEPVGPAEQKMLHQAIVDASNVEGPQQEGMRALAKGIESGKLEFSSINDVLAAGRSLGLSEGAVFRALEPSLDKVGFHGLHVNDAEAGVNRFEFFQKALENNGTDGAKLFESQRAMTPDEGLVPKLNEQELQAAKDKAVEEPKLAVGNEEATAKEAQDVGTKSGEDFEGHVNDALDQAKEQLAELKAEVEDHPHAQEILDEANQIDAEHQEVESTLSKLAKAAFSCIMNNG